MHTGTASVTCPQDACTASRGGPSGAAHRSPHWRIIEPWWRLPVERINEVCARSVDLGLGERPQSHEFGAAREGVLDLAVAQDVGRTGEQESSGRGVPVDGLLDGEQEVGAR